MQAKADDRNADDDGFEAPAFEPVEADAASSRPDGEAC